MASSSPSSPEVSTSEAQPAFSYKTATQEEVLEDLSSRFILNLPDEEFDSLERLCFQVEQAHWFYEDFIREQNMKLPSLPLKKFSEMLFRACPLLNQWSDDHEQAFNQFMQYKTRVPVCGAIMLNDAMDKCVLVKGWKASSGWGFPKGKINEIEPPPACAIREVLEETGYNLAGQLNPNDVVELSIKEQKISLFIVPGVPEDFHFETRTRKEISKIEWFKLTDLPTWKKNKTVAGRFYLISPFISPLRAYISQRKPRNQRKVGRSKKIPGSILEAPNEHAHHESEAEPDHSLATDQEGRRTPRPREIETAIQPEVANLDPQLARLLSSLSLSAKSSGSANAPSGLLSDDAAKHSTPQATAQNNLTATGDSHSLLSQLDWSSSVPPTFENSPYISSAQATEPENRVANGAFSAGNPPMPHLNTNVVDARELMAPSVASTMASPKPNSLSSRRRSSTADISPYLSRAAEVPKSAKELQARSLLESVAVESEKMAHVMAATATTNNPNLEPATHLSSIHPLQMLQPNAADLGILYSSNGGRPIASVNGFHSRPPVQDMSRGFQDLQARSRTSHALHRNPMHNSTGSVNFNQNHQQSLLAAINGPRSHPLHPLYQMGPPHFSHQQPLPPLPPHPHMYNQGSPYYPPLNNTQFVPTHPNNVPYHALQPMHPDNRMTPPPQAGVRNVPSHGLQPMHPNNRMMPPPQAGVRPFSVVHNIQGPNAGPNMIPSDAPQQAASTLLNILNAPRHPIPVPGPLQQ